MAVTPLQRFFSGLEESSHPTYKLYLDKFFNFAKISHEDFNELSVKEQTGIVEEYIFHLRAITDKTGRYENSYNTLFQPVKRYCVMNEILLNWERLFKMMPKPKMLSGRKAYTDDDIKLFLDNCNSSRDKAILHFLNSTAVRPGEMHLLNIEDVRPIQDGAIVRYYAGQKSEYKVCLTPEAYEALKKYLTTRTNTKLDAPLFVTKSEVERRLSKSFFVEFMKGIRNKTFANISKDGSRKEKAANNAFRKRLEAIFSSIEMHHKYHSFLLDHNKDKQDSHYHSHEVIDDETLYDKFRPAIPLITIDKSQMIIAKKENEIETIKEEYKGALKEKIEKQDELMQRMFLELATAKYFMYETRYRECFVGRKDPDLKRLAKLMSNQEIEDWNRIIPIIQKDRDLTIKTGSASDTMLRDSKEKKDIQVLIKSLKAAGKDTSTLEDMLKDYD